MSLIKKLKSYFSFPKIKTVQLSNGKWLALFRKKPFQKWKGAGKNHVWQQPEDVGAFCQYDSEEIAAGYAFATLYPSKPAPTLEDEIKKAMK